MTSQRFNWWVVSGLILLVGIGLQSSSAQQLGDDLFGPRDNSPPRHAHGTVMPGWAFEPDSKSAIRKAAEELRDATDDEAKSKAETNLRDLLGNYFGEDMARREKELEAMQNRLKKLQEQLAKRRDKMQEIVDLQIKVLINEADGLGFFSGNPLHNDLQGAIGPNPFSPSLERARTILRTAAPIPGAAPAAQALADPTTLTPLESNQQPVPGAESP